MEEKKKASSSKQKEFKRKLKKLAREKEEIAELEKQ